MPIFQKTPPFKNNFYWLLDGLYSYHTKIYLIVSSVISLANTEIKEKAFRDVVS